MTKRSEVPEPVVSVGYTYDQLFPLLRATLESGVSALLLGPPGVGKSSLAAELARAMRRRLIDIRLAQKDPAELGGVYFPDRETHTLELFPPGTGRSVTSSVQAPLRAAAKAAHTPAGPAPITATVSCGFISAREAPQKPVDSRSPVKSAASSDTLSGIRVRPLSP